MENLNPAHAISPVDGRYRDKAEILSYSFSEFALMKDRIIVETKYLRALVAKLNSSGYKHPEVFKEEDLTILVNICRDFSDKDFDEIKRFEKTTNHDVKAVEYFFRSKLQLYGMEKYIPYVHWSLTSEDTDNIARALGLCKGIAVLYGEYEKTIMAVENLAVDGHNTPQLVRTHGQPAMASTVGWTLNIFKKRLEESQKEIKDLKISVKFGGATGGNNAKVFACPEINWREFNEDFVSKLDEEENKTFVRLVLNHFTPQIDSHDTYAKAFDALKRCNSILIDLCKDMWTYISREHFVQMKTEGEVSSSTMPQKVNPIDFENGEGNLEFANSIFAFFCQKLPISREYRDLSDSTVQRNFGVPFAHTLIALQSIQKGLSRLRINSIFLEEELEKSWATIAEGYQVYLRLIGVEKGYELMLDEVRGKKVTKEILHGIVDKIASEFKLDSFDVEKLKSLTPHNYIGDRSF